MWGCRDNLHVAFNPERRDFDVSFLPASAVRPAGVVFRRPGMGLSTFRDPIRDPLPNLALDKKPGCLNVRAGLDRFWESRLTL